MISVERRQHTPTDTPWWWLRGATYPHRHTLKRCGCRWSKRQRAWYFIGQTLPTAIHALIDPPPDDDSPCSQQDAVVTLDVALAPTTPPPMNLPSVSLQEAETPNIRITKPVFHDIEPQAVIAAMRQTHRQSPPISSSCPTASGKRHLIRIPQAPCGELTGSVTGSVWCYGWAVHDGVCIYLNMGGPRMAVEAIRAKLAQGDQVTCVPHHVDAPRHFDPYGGNLVIACVDNHEARKEINRVNGYGVYAGNHTDSGQVCIGNADNPDLMRKFINGRDDKYPYLPKEGLLFPELLQPEPLRPMLEPTASCAELVAEGPAGE